MTLRDFARAYAVVWGITLSVAAMVAAVPGAASATRGALGLRLEPAPGDWDDALAYLTTNARVVAAIFLAAWARSRSGQFGYLLDVVVALVVVGNAALVGAAIGSYGPRLLPWLIHLPAEWAAIALAGQAFRAEGASRHSRQLRVVGAAVAAAALAAGAVLESFATPQR